MIKSIVTAIALTTIATTSFADKCGFMCKLAYGGGYATVAEAKTAWETKQKAHAAEQMESTGKSVLVQGNYVYVDNGEGVTMVATSEIKGKSKAQIKEIIIGAVTDDVIISKTLEATGGTLEDLAAAAADMGLTVDELKHDIVRQFEDSNGITAAAGAAADIESAAMDKAFNEELANKASGLSLADALDAAGNIDYSKVEAATDGVSEELHNAIQNDYISPEQEMAKCAADPNCTVPSGDGSGGPVPAS